MLAVNIFALAILAGSLFYLDSFRERLTQARLANARTTATLTADVMAVASEESQQPLLVRLGRDARVRIRVYDADGALRLDSWRGAEPSYRLREPGDEPWTMDAARILDNVFDFIVRAKRPPMLQPGGVDELDNWPEAGDALRRRIPVTMLRQAPEGTPYVSAAATVPEPGEGVLLVTDNATEVRQVVRAERLTLSIILFATIALSALLSRFLGRTIAEPLRRLALAAHRVRLGRAREVAVPRLPERRDEIGLLARALYDMTQSLRSRIDSTEAFAADVTHELKNPLASLRSAVDSLERVEDPGLRRQLIDVVRSDVGRLDRLIVEIAEISRLDAELSRARFEPVDLGLLIEAMVEMWESRPGARGVRIAFAHPSAGSIVVTGDESRLQRLIDNVVDNAISFSPDGGLIEIVAAEADGEIVVSVEDEGPGVAPEAREAIFNRFHSIRGEEDFGRHSGLGLAIARAIAEGHGGRIEAGDRRDGRGGARFVIRLPGA